MSLRKTDIAAVATAVFLTLCGVGACFAHSTAPVARSVAAGVAAPADSTPSAQSTPDDDTPWG